MKNSDSQMILYAKGWFEKGDDLIEDLCTIHGDSYLISHNKNTNVYNIKNYLLILVQKYCISYRTQLDRFLEELFQWEKLETSYTIEELSIKIITHCLKLLSNIQINNDTKVLIKLDEPNFDLLPMKSSITKEHYESTFKKA